MKTWGDGYQPSSMERVLKYWGGGGGCVEGRVQTQQGQITEPKASPQYRLAINVRLTTTEVKSQMLCSPSLSPSPTSLSRCHYIRDKNKGPVFGSIKQHKQGRGPLPCSNPCNLPPRTLLPDKPPSLDFALFCGSVLGLEWSWRITQGQPLIFPHVHKKLERQMQLVLGLNVFILFVLQGDGGDRKGERARLFGRSLTQFPYSIDHD